MKPRGNKPGGRRRTRRGTQYQDDKIYFEGKIVETFPAAVFGVEVPRKNDLPPIQIKASTKTALKLRKVMIIKGDSVRVEINPEDMSSDEGVLKGTIVERINIPRPPVINK